MPILDASALTQEPESLEFLRDVLGPAETAPSFAERFPGAGAPELQMPGGLCGLSGEARRDFADLVA